jgi:hypothetical protein
LAQSAGNHYVYVVDDPNIIMRVQFDSTGVAQSKLHNLCGITQTAVNSSLSQYSPLSNTVATGPATAYTANTTILQILGAETISTNLIGLSTAASTSTAVPFLNVLVKWNQHQYFGGAVGV